MKNTIKSAFAVFISFSVMACGNEQGSDSTTKNQEHDNHEGETNTTAAAPAGVRLKEENANAIYQHYVHLTNALVKSDAAEARVAANAIEAGAKNVSGADKLGAAASKLAASNDIEKQRTVYSDLSDEMINFAKKSGLASGELYVDYCPMAMNDQGAYWLSSVKDIKNPYFGDKMLTCGEVKETLK